MGSIEERLAAIEAIVGRIEQRLFGNGQPGEIERISARLAALEAWRWKAAGAIALAAVLAGAIGAVVRL